MSKFKVEIANGLRDIVMVARHGGARSLAQIDTVFTLLRAPAVEVRLADTTLPPRPYRRSRPATLDRLRGEAATHPIAARPQTLSRRDAPYNSPCQGARRRAQLPRGRRDLGTHDAERTFNFEPHWAALVAEAPRGAAWSLAGPRTASAGHLADVRATPSFDAAAPGSMSTASKPSPDGVEPQSARRDTPSDVDAEVESALTSISMSKDPCPRGEILFSMTHWPY
ncbi:hypothetical protein PRJ39_25115 [Lysobacter enzymogenes]|uniref:hypothetical protein n=1 Tax=Lysobacter enzymogenes TaxID=69 RepID=UPI00374A4362